MRPKQQHAWNINTQEAKQIQTTLAKQVVTEDRFNTIETVAGADVGYHKASRRCAASVAVLDAKSLALVELVTVIDKERFPYIPGYLSFRELPVIALALAKLKTKPDLIVCDGQGLAHPRRFGVACHLGVLFDIPTIGCGKTRLIGEYQEPATKKGSYAKLTHNNDHIGYVLRTRTDVKPLYVSAGHRVCHKTSMQWILKLCPKYRIPLTTRYTDSEVKKAFN